MKTFKKITAATVVAFFISLILCTVLIAFSVYNRCHVEQLTMDQIIMEKSAKVNEVITRLLFKTQTLSALVIQNNGEITDFERVAATILDDPVILNVLVAPDGVVSHVYPITGNEAVIGFDFFSESAGNKEALMAVETGELVFGGPFDLVQGGQALVGRLPVYLTTQEGEKRFWGLVSVTISYPQVLENTGLSLLQQQGFAFEIWRINPDTNEKQIIAHSDYAYKKGERFVERHIPLFNADWYCRISPVHNWYEYPETWLLCVVALMISLLIASVTQHNHDLTNMQGKLEVMARTDALTGIHNRRFFMEIAEMQIKKARRMQSECYAVIFDLDYFKQINDTYGHLTGDELLKRVSQRVKNMLRDYDVLARYGGEEFIVLFTDINRGDVVQLIERVRQCIGETPYVINDISLSITASFGIAQATDDYHLDKTIDHADQALYKAKAAGRDRVEIYN